MTPYYSDDSVTLYCGDFREHLAGLSADLIVADPPYGETALQWDRWPAGWPALVTGAASAMWCFGSMRMFIDQAHEFEHWKLSQDIVWQKANGTGFATDRFKRVHEIVTHWYRGDWSTAHHDTPRVSYAGPAKHARASASRTSHTGAIGASTYEDDGTRLMRSVIDARSVRGGLHPTEKPVSLVESLIHYGCPSGGVVLDPFAGSASTLVAARAIGRRAIGFEIREEQCEAAAKRLAQQHLAFGEVS